MFTGYTKEAMLLYVVYKSPVDHTSTLETCIHFGDRFTRATVIVLSPEGIPVIHAEGLRKQLRLANSHGILDRYENLLNRFLSGELSTTTGKV